MQQYMVCTCVMILYRALIQGVAGMSGKVLGDQLKMWHTDRSVNVIHKILGFISASQTHTYAVGARVITHNK